MRHGLAGNKLGRSSSLRKATVRDIAKATLLHQRICTTKAKAKEARKLVERLITLGKKGTLAGRRKAFSILCDHKLVSSLFTNISPRFKNRAGGYTRIIPLAKVRRGDNAVLAFLELTEKDKTIVSKAKLYSVDASAGQLPEGDGAHGHDHAHEHPHKEKAAAEAPAAVKEQKALAKKAAPKAKETKIEKPQPGKKLVGGIKQIFKKKPAANKKDSK